MIGIIIALVLVLAVGYWYLYMRCPLTLPKGASKLSDPGSGYCGVSGYQPNAGSNAGNATPADTPADCAKICDSRAGCTGYKFHANVCFPIKFPDPAATSKAMAKADGWSTGYKISAGSGA